MTPLLSLLLAVFVCLACGDIKHSLGFKRASKLKYISDPNHKCESSCIIRGGHSSYFDDDDIPEFTLSKDREIFYASIDLKWFLGLITSGEFWSNTTKSAITCFQSLFTKKKEGHVLDALEILSSIRSMKTNSNLKVIRGSIFEAEQVAKQQNKPLLLYVEDDACDMNDVMGYRMALADNTFGSFLNTNFIVSVHNTRQQATLKYLSKYSIEAPFPAFIVISPMNSSLEVNTTNSKLQKSEISTQVLAVIRLSAEELGQNMINNYNSNNLLSKMKSLHSLHMSRCNNYSNTNKVLSLSKTQRALEYIRRNFKLRVRNSKE